MSTDDRQVFRIQVDILATEEQRMAVQDLLGEAVCGEPLDHNGPCRLAWQISYLSEEGDSLSSAEVAEIRTDLSHVQVWPRHRVDQSLLAHRPQV